MWIGASAGLGGNSAEYSLYRNRWIVFLSLGLGPLGIWPQGFRARWLGSEKGCGYALSSL